MITSKKIDLVNVFTGSPWEIATVAGLLSAAYIHALVKDEGRKEMKLMVPGECYSAAVRVIENRDSL